jgi:quinol monooxygenase YgiN
VDDWLELTSVILVTGSILAHPETIEELLTLSLEHVKRSRVEPGCRSHAVHRDAENPLRLVFLEEWDDHATLAAHFAVPASRAFVKAASALADGTPTLNIFQATPTRV